MPYRFNQLPDNLRDKLKEEKPPRWIDPMLVRLTEKRFTSDGWIFERKLDGQRCLTFREWIDSAPVDLKGKKKWEKLEDSRFDSQRYTIRNIFRRLGKKENPWKHMDLHGRSLEKTQQNLKKLSDD